MELKTQLAILAGTLMACSVWYNSVKADQGDMYLNIHGLSSHLDHDEYYTETTEGCRCYTTTPFREFNPGLGISYEMVNGIEARGGFFLNSFDKTSVYGSINWHTSYNRPVALGIQAGIVSGYKDTPMGGDTPLMGFLLPSISANAGGFRAELGYSPRLQSHQSSIVTLTFGVQFK